MSPAAADFMPRVFASVLAPGSCEWLLQHTEAAFRTAFAIRDHRHGLAALPQRLQAQLRAGIFTNAGVFPVVFLRFLRACGTPSIRSGPLQAAPRDPPGLCLLLSIQGSTIDALPPRGRMRMMRPMPGLAHPAPGPNQPGRQPAHLANLCGFRDCSFGDSLGHPGAIVIENRRLYAAAQPDGSVVLPGAVPGRRGR